MSGGDASTGLHANFVVSRLLTTRTAGRARCPRWAAESLPAARAFAQKYVVA
jgi:hypothetical protein